MLPGSGRKGRIIEKLNYLFSFFQWHFKWYHSKATHVLKEAILSNCSVSRHTFTYKQWITMGPFCDEDLDCHFSISSISLMKSLINVDWFHSLMHNCFIVLCSDSCKQLQFCGGHILLEYLILSKPTLVTIVVRAESKFSDVKLRRIWLFFSKKHWI